MIVGNTSFWACSWWKWIPFTHFNREQYAVILVLKKQAAVDLENKNHAKPRIGNHVYLPKIQGLFAGPKEHQKIPPECSEKRGLNWMPPRNKPESRGPCGKVGVSADLLVKRVPLARDHGLSRSSSNSFALDAMFQSWAGRVVKIGPSLTVNLEHKMDFDPL